MTIVSILCAFTDQILVQIYYILIRADFFLNISALGNDDLGCLNAIASNKNTQT